MKTITVHTPAAQGELMARGGKMPRGLKPAALENGRYILAHSETGHHHVMVLERDEAGVPNVELYDTDNPLVSWLKVNRPTALEHLRPHDTHEPHLYQPGEYEIIRQREFDHYADLAVRAID